MCSLLGVSNGVMGFSSSRGGITYICRSVAVGTHQISLVLCRSQESYWHLLQSVVSTPSYAAFALGSSSLVAGGWLPSTGAVQRLSLRLLRSEEHTSELQSNISYAVFCLKKKNKH